MHVHEQPRDRRQGDLLIRQGFIVTLACFWTTILAVLWAFTPLSARGVWPLLAVVETAGGRKAPIFEGDLFLSVTRTGEVYLDEHKATQAEVMRACAMAMRPRLDWRGESYRDQIFVRVDKAAPFGAVRVVLRAAQEAKVDRVTFLAKPAENSRDSIYY